MKSREKPKTLESLTFIGYYSMRTSFGWIHQPSSTLSSTDHSPVFDMFLTTKTKNVLHTAHNFNILQGFSIIRVFDHIDACIEFCSSGGGGVHRSFKFPSLCSGLSPHSQHSSVTGSASRFHILPMLYDPPVPPGQLFVWRDFHIYNLGLLHSVAPTPQFGF